SSKPAPDRPSYCSLLPLDFGVIGGMNVRLQLYTVPGQVFYNATRRLVLKGVDGVVFVADSQAAALEPNEESLANLKTNLEELSLGVDQVPVVFQYNKRDLRNILPVPKLHSLLNAGQAPEFEAAAIHGVGVFETLKEISRLALASIRNRIAEETKKASGGPNITPSLAFDASSAAAKSSALASSSPTISLKAPPPPAAPAVASPPTVTLRAPISPAPSPALEKPAVAKPPLA